MSHKILITGITSFTGTYIAKTLLENGYTIYAPLTQADINSYTGIKKQRLNLIPDMNTLPDCTLNSEKLINNIKDIKPEIFINHAADTEDYRSPNYKVTEKLNNTLSNIHHIIQTLKDNGCKLFIHSGSMFEPAGGLSEHGVSPYGVSKKMAWDLIKHHCQKANLPCLKIYIPNPYGHLENEDRLMPVLRKCINSQKEFTLRGSRNISNNIEVTELAKYYLQGVQIADQNLPPNWLMEIRPIGHLESQLQFVKRASQSYPYTIDSKELEKYLIISD